MKSDYNNSLMPLTVITLISNYNIFVIHFQVVGVDGAELGPFLVRGDRPSLAGDH